jgi:hypothetical protein
MVKTGDAAACLLPVAATMLKTRENLDGCKMIFADAVDVLVAAHSHVVAAKQNIITS